MAMTASQAAYKLALAQRTDEQIMAVRPTHKKCSRCGTVKAAGEFPTSRYSKDDLYFWCRACGRLYKNSQREQIRQTVIGAYGGKCACCGEIEIAFLVIDHVNGGGNAHRRELSGGQRSGSDKLYLWLIREGFPPEYQALCANCNMAKERPGGCPHQRGDENR